MKGGGLAAPVACAVGPKNCCALVVLGGDYLQVYLGTPFSFVHWENGRERC